MKYFTSGQGMELVKLFTIGTIRVRLRHTLRVDGQGRELVKLFTSADLCPIFGHVRFSDSGAPHRRARIIAESSCHTEITT